MSRGEYIPNKRERSTTDRLPPHSIEAEQGALGCVFLSPNECLPALIEKIGSDSFYDLRHQEIFVAMLEMFDAREPIDVITLQEHLKDKQALDQVGGIAYLAQMPDAVPSAANLEFYINIIREKHMLRRMIRTCTDIVAKTYDHEGEIDDLMDECEKRMLAISLARATSDSLHNPKELARKVIDTIEAMHQNQGQLTGLSYGLPDMDKLTSGLHGGEMIVIAARPSMGKTSLAMNIAEHVALEQNQAVGVFSLEMTADSLMLRMVCSQARIDIRSIKDGLLTERDFPKIMNATAKLGASRLYIDDSSGLSIMNLRAKARRMWQQYGIKLFVIDYLQLLHSTNKRAENRQQEIADISSGLKSIAKELNVPVIVLAQLNRELEKQPDRKPRMSDLRESGAIEQDADLIGLLYKPMTDEDPPGDGEPLPVNLLVAKQRNGPTGDVSLTFLKKYTRFESVSRFSQAEMEGMAQTQ